MRHDYRGKAVLITGGTCGTGRAIGLAFGKLGAHTYLTHAFGSADEDELRQAYLDVGAPEPTIVNADVAYPEDTTMVLELIKARHDRLAVFVSNVAVAQMVNDKSDLTKRGLTRSLELSTWPLLEYTLAIKEVFGDWPRYVIAMSSYGPETWHMRYEFAGASKAALECSVRYLAERLFDTDCCVNAVRPFWLDTHSGGVVIGDGYLDFVKDLNIPGHLQSPEEVANVVLALCSGWMDGVRGQVLNVDHGVTFANNAMSLYAEHVANNPPKETQP